MTEDFRKVQNQETFEMIEELEQTDNPKTLNAVVFYKVGAQELYQELQQEFLTERAIKMGR